jgi:hypothetical protein
MTTEPNDGQRYLRDSPQVRQWMNERAACHATGYDPDRLDSASHTVRRNLQRYFGPLSLTLEGVCHQCAKALARTRPPA